MSTVLRATQSVVWWHHWHHKPLVILFVTRLSYCSGRVFYDHDFAEIFFMQGRLVMSLGKPQQKNLVAVENGGFSAYTTTSPVVVSKASAWAVGSIWVSKASVLEQHKNSLQRTRSMSTVRHKEKRRFQR